MTSSPDIDVESNPRLTDAVASAQKLKTLLVGLCSTGKHIGTVLCSALSKTAVSDIQAKEMCGKGNTKVSKELLAENVLTLVRQIDLIDPIVNGDPSVLDLEPPQPSPGNSDHTDYVNTIKHSLEHFDATIRSNQDNISKITAMLAQLKNVCSYNKSEGHMHTADMTPCVKQRPTPCAKILASSKHLELAPVINPTTAYEQYQPDFVTNDLHSKLTDFIQGISDYHKVNGREVRSFGARYPYPGAPAADISDSEFPPPVKELVALIEQHHPRAQLNSCLITK